MFRERKKEKASEKEREREESERNVKRGKVAKYIEKERDMKC